MPCFYDLTIWTSKLPVQDRIWEWSCLYRRFFMWSHWWYHQERCMCKLQGPFLLSFVYPGKSHDNVYCMTLKCLKGNSYDLKSTCLFFSTILSSSGCIFYIFQYHHWCHIVLKIKIFCWGIRQSKEHLDCFEMQVPGWFFFQNTLSLDWIMLAKMQSTIGCHLSNPSSPS